MPPSRAVTGFFLFFFCVCASAETACTQTNGGGRCYPSYEIEMSADIAFCSTTLVQSIGANRAEDGQNFSFFIEKISPSQLSGVERMICSSFLGNRSDYSNKSGGELHRCYKASGFFNPEPKDFAMWCTEGYSESGLYEVSCENNLQGLAIDFHPSGRFVSRPLSTELLPENNAQNFTISRGNCKTLGRGEFPLPR